ncbi:GTP-binding protein [Edaphobacillus lindanitolerans]|nr:TetM/TetW/TetO/TetS family tetracycline resistance ribosomal protection protein [Edaphobacillus lindanitolerans]
MHRTIGVLAHVDAGKTTFSEQLLYHTEAIRRRGRVDHRDAFLDSHEIEKNRGITVFADQAVFQYNGTDYTLIDTPGHVDFSPEMERATGVMDAAIVIVSAADGVEGHTETVWELLGKQGVPAFLFLNKTDREGADPQQVLTGIRSSLSEDAFLLDDGLTSELAEWIAERDEELLERFVDDRYDEEVWIAAMRRMIAERRIFPVMTGSALKDTGIVEFLGWLDLLTETAWDQDAPFAARVYKIRHDDSGQRVTFLKLLAGRLSVRDEFTLHGEAEKITQIRRYNGHRYEARDAAYAGELIAVTGLSGAHAGEIMGGAGSRAGFTLIPSLSASVRFDPSIPATDMLGHFRKLDAEDPSLSVVWDESSREIRVRVMGKIQLDVLKEVVKERFGTEISFGEPSILYKETIRSAVNGYGHFEPLRHYSEVHLRIEPAGRGTGISFESECHPNALAPGYQNLVGQTLTEKPHRGILAGAPLTDLKITLTNGRAHNEHTAGGDFREASLRALRQGLEKADNVLLEPVYDVKAKVSPDQMGRVLSDIQQAHGRFEAPEQAGGAALIKGRVPVATFMDYPAAFASFTNGKGTLSLRPGGYEECHNTEDVIGHAGYDKDADPEYSSSSVFCAKGKGYTVPWDEAEEAMHLL